MKAESVAISSLSPDPANVRKHPQRNIETIVASLKRFGQQKPIVVDVKGIVRAGNGTLEAAKLLGWTEISIVRSNLIGPEATAYAIADNRTSELAEWDEDGLVAILNSMDAEIREAAGWSEAELAAISPNFGAVRADSQSQLDEKAKVECPKCGYEFTP